ncbi:MAG: hypothetical protein GX854_00190 [Clostridiales bacterium]|nr:hypothetical protein [Clostridiales bacterium]
MIIKNIKFISLEFDFGYSEESEEDKKNLGRIDAEVLVEIDDNGESKVITHKTRLDEASFLDFMSEQEVEKLNFGTDFSTSIQQLRKLVAMKTASDFGFELADVGYIQRTPIRNDVEELRTRITATEDAVLLLMMEGMM